MEKQDNDANNPQMNEEALAYFLKGLKIAIKQSGLTRAAFAEGVTSSVNISNILRGKTGTSEKMREALARKAGKDVAELVLMGKTAEMPPASQQLDAISVPGVEAKYVDPMDVVAAMSSASSAVSLLARQCQEENKKKKYWRSIFDEMPVAAFVVRDGIVYYQNIKSSAWGNITGVPICDSCACPGDCKKKHECPIYQAMDTRNQTTGYQYIGSVYYKVNIAPLRYNWNDHEYFIVVATETEEKIGEDRRVGEDRRKTEGGE